MRSSTPTPDDLEAAIIDWLATPTELRDPQTLRALARSLGVEPNGHFYQLVSSPEVSRKALVAAAGGVLPSLPDILQVLIDRALDGNVKAADVVLRHARELARMAAVADSGKIQAPLAQHLQETGRVAKDLVALADAFSEGPAKADRRPQRATPELRSHVAAG